MNTQQTNTKRIIVNGRTKIYNKEKVGVSDISILAYGRDVTFGNKPVALTITYSDKGKKSGSITGKEKIKINEGMIFNAVLTDRA